MRVYESNREKDAMTTQFSLGALLEYMTFCAILAAFAGVTGAVAIGFLMLFALALMVRQGLLAIAALAAGVVSCGGSDARRLGSARSRSCWPL
jgi:hypothetical protein